jgi:pimeloyl-ACP methyl ester carboxylesterase
MGHWRHNLPVFSQHHPVYALDLLGFGSSEKVVANYGIPLWMEQVHDFWQTFIQTPVVLVGNSIGSLICLATAATYPQMVQGLVMLNLPDASVLEAPAWAQPAVATLSRWTELPLAFTKWVFTVAPA